MNINVQEDREAGEEEGKNPHEVMRTVMGGGVSERDDCGGEESCVSWVRGAGGR